MAKVLNQILVKRKILILYKPANYSATAMVVSSASGTG